MKIGDWTQEEVEVLKEMWPNTPNRAQIAAVLGRTPSAISAKASHLGLISELTLRKFPKLKPKERNCLVCDEGFTSEGNHNRVCFSCKRTEMWLTG